jgi:ech hydrogenase subunit A
MVNLGVYVLLRFSPLVATVPSMGLALTLVGGFSFLVTSVLALRHSNAKRVLAYSTVANLALIVVCVGIGTPLAIAAGMLILIYHAVSKALLFLTVGAVKHETGSEDIESMADLRQRMPMLAVSLYAGVFLMVLPAFGLFAGKWMLSEASVDSLPFLFLFAVAIAVPMAYYAKWLGRAMTSGPREVGAALRWDEPSPWFTIPLLVLITAAFALSLGLPYVVDALVAPYINTFSTSPIDGDLLALTTPLGTLPVAPLALIVLVPLLALFLTIRPTKEEISQAYTCGEGGSFMVVGSYLFSETKERALLVISDVVGIALLSSIIAMAIFEGVLA